MRFDEAPSYLKAADSHNVASDNTSIFEDVATALGNSPEFLTVSAASALNSFYNTGVAVNNIFSSEEGQMAQRDTKEFIAGMDDDLSQYYQENKEAADLTGFIAGSILPGLGGIKVLRAGQSALRAAEAGAVGSNMRLATNLLAPSMETYVKRAGADLAAKSATFSFSQTNSLKALAAGVHQAALESAAFEVAVAATMFESPILSEMDTTDLIKNMVFGTVLGAGIGGIGAAAGTYFGVKKLLQNADARQMGFVKSTQLTSSSEATIHSDRIVMNARDAAELAQPVTPEMVLAKKLAQGESGESIATEALKSEAAKINRLREANLQKLANERRQLIRKVAGEEDVLGNQFTDMTLKLGPTETMNTFFNLKSLSRLATPSTVMQQAKALVKQGLAKTTKQAVKQVTDEQDLFIRMHSGKVGDVITKSPGRPRLADKFTPDQMKSQLTKAGVSLKDATDFRAITSAEEAELRWYAARSMELPLNDKSIVGYHDLPFLDKAVREGRDSLLIKTPEGGAIQLNGKDEILNHLKKVKAEVLEAQKGKKRGTDFLELISDVRQDFIEGTSKYTDEVDNLFATQSYAKELEQFIQQPVTAKQLMERPRIVRATYKVDNIQSQDGMLLEGMALIKYRETLAKEAMDRVFANFAGDTGELFPQIQEELLRKANRTGGGAGTFTNAGAAYGTLEETTSYIGQLTSELKRAVSRKTTDELTPIAQRLIESPEDAVRFSGINEIISNQVEKFVLNEAGDALIPVKVRDYQKALLAGENVNPPQLFRGTPDEIPLESETLREAVAAHIALNGKRNQSWKELNAAQGNEDRKLLDVFYPVRPNPRDYRFVAFVKDETLTGVGHTKMLFANTAKELEDQINLVPSQYKVYTKGQSEEFYNARGEWIYDKTLHDNYIDHDMLARGISSRFFPQTDPQKIANSWLQDHLTKDNALTTQMIVAKYEKEIKELRRLGDQFANVESSRTGKDSITEMLTNKNPNPYYAQVKSMLNITKLDEVPLITTVNQTLDTFVSRAWNKAQDVFTSAGGKVSEEKVEQINRIFDELGIKTAYYDTATTLMANANLPRGALTSFVRKANAFLTTTVLRLDPFNALNNLLGNTVLFSAELKSLTKAIEKGSAEGAGELAQLMKIGIPGVEGDLIRSPAKLIARSFQRLHGPEREKLLAEYNKRGFLPDLSDQYYKSLDAMTLSGQETVRDLHSKMGKLDEAWEAFGKAGEKWTGNKWTEQFNRLVSADVVKQITEIGVKHGVLDEKAAWAYVNTFVSRVNGVIRAAERPLMFQGPIGQAMGLFQSYQFNLMQQVFRYVGEGKGKTIAMLAGLQGSIYGASSLPGFNLINNHLIGNAYGNSEHKDLYSATQTLFGKTGAEWIMYGAPSNILRASLFTRGDTNPRTWSIVPNPTNPGDLPFISAFGKAFGSTKDALTNIAGGAPVWESLLSGVEHLGLNRPLAGLAATARSFSREDEKVVATQANGTILGSNDLYSWSTLVRLAGAKPIDDAIASNAFFRVQAYRASDVEKKAKLATQLKLGLMDGEGIDPEKVGEFAQRYVELGGKQSGFNQFFMQQYKNTDLTRAEQLSQSLNSPYARYMQEIMGGRDSLEEL